MGWKKELERFRKDIKYINNRVEDLRHELADQGLAWWHLRRPAINIMNLAAKVDLILESLGLCYEPASTETKKIPAKLVNCENGDKSEDEL